MQAEKMTGEQFAAIRHQLGLSQAQLGAIMGMRAQEISRIETKTGPTKQQSAFIRYICISPPPTAPSASVSIQLAKAMEILSETFLQANDLIQVVDDPIGVDLTVENDLFVTRIHLSTKI